MLDAIFFKLDIPTVKEVRLVCRTWSDVGASHLGHRTILNLARGFPEEPYVFNPKLARRLELIYPKPMTPIPLSMKAPRPPVELPLPPPRYEDFPKLAAYTHNFTTEVTFVMTKEFYPHFVQAFLTNEFPVLHSIILHEPVVTGYETPPVTFPKRESIQRIEYVACHPRPKDATALFPLHPLIQGLIDAAPSLQKLSISDNFYPSLVTCKKLRALTFVGCPVHEKPENSSIPLPDATFSLPSVTEMVTQVADTLEQLTLACIPSDLTSFNGWLKMLEDRPIFEFQLPAMPRLTRMHVVGVEVYTQLGKCLYQRRFPNLKHIELRELVLWRRSRVQAPQAFRMEPFLHGIQPHSGLESLNIHIITNYEPIVMRRLARIWPNVTKLKYEMGAQAMEVEKVDCLNNWRLTHLDVIVTLSRHVINIIDSLTSLTTFSGWGIFLSRNLPWNFVNLNFLKLGIKTVEVKDACMDAPLLQYSISKWDILLVSLGYKSLTFRDCSVNFSFWRVCFHTML